MDNKKHNLFFTTCAALILFAILCTPVSALSDDSVKRFSFRFENCTVSDALSEISAKIGIDITAKSALKKEIASKSYVNRRLDSIINDLLRGEDCAVVWNYNEGSLFSIDLYTFDENDVKRTGSVSINRSNSTSSFVNRNTREINQIRNRSLSSNSSRSNRSVSSSRTSAQRGASGNTTSGSSTTYGTSGRTNTGGNTASGSSRVSANMRRAVIDNQNSETDDETGEEEEAKNTAPPPEEPEEEKGIGLERPPMPPGL